jgi:hypothetical protein
MLRSATLLQTQRKYFLHVMSTTNRNMHLESQMNHKSGPQQQQGHSQRYQHNDDAIQQCDPMPLFLAIAFQLPSVATQSRPNLAQQFAR